MRNNKFIKKIMSRIATKEKERLKKILKFSIPILFILLLVIGVAFYRVIAGLVKNGALDIITATEYDWSFFSHQLPQVIIWIWELLEKGFLLTIILAILGLIVFMRKTKLISFPRRFREIAKYNKK